MEVVEIPSWHPDTGRVGDLGQSFPSVQQEPGMESLFFGHVLVSAALSTHQHTPLHTHKQEKLCSGDGWETYDSRVACLVFLLLSVFPLLSLEKDSQEKANA